MRRTRFIPALLVFLLSACSETVIQQWPSQDEAEGYVSIRLSNSTDKQNIETKTDAEGPVLDDFRVAIYAGDTKMRLYNDSYAVAKNAKIKLNSKEHRLVAQHGDSLGCGFDKPYYLADKTFMVVKGENTVAAEAALANVKIKVEYDATISEAYPDYYAVVKHNTYTSKSLKFSKSETRFGYIPGGELTLEIYAKIDGEWKYYSTVPGTYEPNDFVTFIVTTNNSEGSLRVNITVDTATEDRSESIEIPAYTVPQDAPSITLAGFDGSGNVHEFVEGVTEGSNAMANFVARGAIQSCVLTTDSDYLEAKGIPTELEFTALTADQKATLTAAGFDWDKNMKTSRNFSFIDFSGVIAKMLADTKSTDKDVEMASFSLKVIDAVGKTEISNFSIVSAAVKTTLAIEDYNVWAKRIVNPVVTFNKGKSSLVTLQYSLDRAVWTDFNVSPAQNSNTLTYETVPVSAGTKYYIRAIYNNNVATASPVKEVTTEAAAQLGNSGFESWTEKEYSYDQTLFDQNNNLPWYQPWSGNDQWWDTNATNSMRNDLTAAYTFFKTFPLVQWSTDARSGKSAQLTVVNVGNANSTAAGAGTNGSWYVGELFLGRGNDADDGDWQKTSEGHAFTSRPDALTFWYEYVPYSSSDTFGVEIIVKSEDGTELAKTNVTGSAASSWKMMSVNLPYSVKNKKAAKIFVNFKASTSSDHSCAVGGEYLEVAGSKPEGDASRIKLSATLRIDDVQLVY